MWVRVCAGVGAWVVVRGRARVRNGKWENGKGKGQREKGKGKKRDVADKETPL